MNILKGVGKMSEEKLMKLNKIGQKTNKVSLIGIHKNFPFALQSRVKSSHNHSQLTKTFYTGQNKSRASVVRKSDSEEDGLTEPFFEGQKADNSIKMLPLTEVKGNC